MSKIKIRAGSWNVYADTGEQFPPFLASISRSAYQDCFFVISGRNSQQQPPTFATFTEAVEYIRANQAEAAA